MERPKRFTERFPASVSVSLLLTHGRSDRLLLTRHGVKNGDPATWGLVAGGVEKEENPWKAAMREAKEEAGLNEKNIIIVPGRNELQPHVAVLQREDKHRVGIVLDVTYSGPTVPLDGWCISRDRKVDMAKFFSWQDVLELMDKKQEIYIPEFNYPQLLRWMLKGCWTNPSRIRSTNRWLEERSDEIEGLLKKECSSDNLLGGWEYLPSYNSWLTKPGIHGFPDRTNFARRRYLDKSKK